MTVAKVTSPSKGSLRWIKGAKRPTPHKIPPQTKRADIAFEAGDHIGPKWDPH